MKLDGGLSRLFFVHSVLFCHAVLNNERKCVSFNMFCFRTFHAFKPSDSQAVIIPQKVEVENRICFDDKIVFILEVQCVLWTSFSAFQSCGVCQLPSPLISLFFEGNRSSLVSLCANKYEDCAMQTAVVGEGVGIGAVECQFGRHNVFPLVERDSLSTGRLD